MHGRLNTRAQHTLHIAEHRLLVIRFTPQGGLARKLQFRLHKEQFFTAHGYVPSCLAQKLLRPFALPDDSDLLSVDPDMKKVVPRLLIGRIPLKIQQAAKQYEHRNINICKL